MKITFEVQSGRDTMLAVVAAVAKQSSPSCTMGYMLQALQNAMASMGKEDREFYKFYVMPTLVRATQEIVDDENAKWGASSASPNAVRAIESWQKSGFIDS